MPASRNGNNKSDQRAIAAPTAKRLSEYLIILEELEAQGKDIVSSRELADYYGNNANQVRQDLSSMPHSGSRGHGYRTHGLQREIRHALGLNVQRRVAVVGCGRLGTTLALHVPLANYGMSLVAAFDVAPHIVRTNLGAVRVDHADHIAEICRERCVELAALSVPRDAAQQAADELVEGGVIGILNYTLVQLKVPENVVVENRQIICSFIQLTHRVSAHHADPMLTSDDDRA